jgi:hypothetical protein
VVQSRWVVDRGSECGRNEEKCIKRRESEGRWKKVKEKVKGKGKVVTVL